MDFYTKPEKRKRSQLKKKRNLEKMEKILLVELQPRIR